VRVVGYARVSTDLQADQGISLEAQASKIRSYCDLHDLELVEILEESASGKNLRRPKLQRALQMLREDEADSLLVVKLDRLTRSLRDLLELIESYFQDRYSLLSVAEHIDTRTAAGRLMLNLLMVVAQWERETIGERTAFALRHLADLGFWTGTRPPYGWKPGLPDADGRRRLVLDMAEQRVINDAIELRLAGHSLRSVGQELWDRGHRPRSADTWSPELIDRITKPARQAQAG
jgi:DNA invertase Pin-like site-specific DNA recombinase